MCSVGILSKYQIECRGAWEPWRYLDWLGEVDSSPILPQRWLVKLHPLLSGCPARPATDMRLRSRLLTRRSPDTRRVCLTREHSGETVAPPAVCTKPGSTLTGWRDQRNSPPLPSGPASHSAAAGGPVCSAGISLEGGGFCACPPAPGSDVYRTVPHTVLAGGLDCSAEESGTVEDGNECMNIENDVQNVLDNNPVCWLSNSGLSLTAR